jgi:thymidylate kinase
VSPALAETLTQQQSGPASQVRARARGRGLLVVLLGPDGAGKSTLAQALANDNNVRARLIYMGSNVYAGNVGLPTSRWLHEIRKSARPGRLSKPILAIVSFADSFATHCIRCLFARYHRFCGRVVVLDRHIFDSWIAKPAPTPARRLRRRLFESGFPAPDLVFLLDAPGELLFQRKGEHTAEWLEAQRLAYLGLQHRLPQMVVVDGTQPAQEVRRQVTLMILNHYQSRCRGQA